MCPYLARKNITLREINPKRDPHEDDVKTTIKTTTESGSDFNQTSIGADQITTTETVILKTTKAPGANKEILIINGCNITFLPSNLPQYFSNLKILIVWFSGLKYFERRDLYLGPNITEINFQDNLIENFPDNPFLNNTELKKLNFGGNRIKDLPENLLVYSVDLLVFIADRNLIEFLPKLIFSKNIYLEFVNLNNNRIKRIAVDFTKMPNIERVLGLNNVCANFYLNRKMNAIQLNKLVRANCTKVKNTAK